MVEVTGEGQVIYKTGDNRLGHFPKAASEDLLAGPKQTVSAEVWGRKNPRVHPARGPPAFAPVILFGVIRRMRPSA